MLSESALRQDLQAAMKAQDRPRVYVLRGVLAAVGNAKIEKGGEAPNAAEIVAIVQREAKKREEAEAFARTANRTDLAEQNAAERSILAEYLPRPLEDAELGNLVRSWLAEGVDGLGPLMARLKERHAGQYDGKRASEIVRRILTGG
jgi:uncharacterized protein YqeY